MSLQRAAVLLVAVLAIAWLGVSYDDARKINQAQATVGNPKATEAEIAAALADARSADALDPSTDPLSTEAALEIKAKHLPEALRLLDELVKREPDAAEPWLLIAELTRTSDPARSAEARAELRRLDPLQAQAPSR
jgi:predicted Zn-dependent protease